MTAPTLTLPSTPTPQSDSWIMLTSLPPSPVQNTEQRGEVGMWRRERDGSHAAFSHNDDP